MPPAGPAAPPPNGTMSATPCSCPGHTYMRWRVFSHGALQRPGKQQDSLNRLVLEERTWFWEIIQISHQPPTQQGTPRLLLSPHSPQTRARLCNSVASPNPLKPADGGGWAASQLPNGNRFAGGASDPKPPIPRSSASAPTPDLTEGPRLGFSACQAGSSNIAAGNAPFSTENSPVSSTSRCELKSKKGCGRGSSKNPGHCSVQTSHVDMGKLRLSTDRAE